MELDPEIEEIERKNRLAQVDQELIRRVLSNHRESHGNRAANNQQPRDERGRWQEKASWR